MKIKVFYPNEKGNIEITKEKLESLLNEAYVEGYRDGKNDNNHFYYRNGDYSISTTPYVTYANASPLLQSDKALATDCCINANDTVKADVLKNEAKSAITVEYGEVTNAH
jgi:hypothetical protein